MKVRLTPETRTKIIDEITIYLSIAEARFLAIALEMARSQNAEVVERMKQDEGLSMMAQSNVDNIEQFLEKIKKEIDKAKE